MELIRKQEIIDQLDYCANLLYEKGNIVGSGMFVILRDSILDGNYDAPKEKKKGRQT